MQRTSWTWLSAVAGLFVAVGVGLSPPASAQGRASGVAVTLKGHWLRTTYDVFGTRTISGGSECTPELPKTGLTAAWATLTSDGYSVSGGGGALAESTECPPVKAELRFDTEPTNRATYMRTNASSGWVEAEADCTADCNVSLVGADSFATISASVAFTSDVTGTIRATQGLALNTDVDKLMNYDAPNVAYHGHGCGWRSSFQWTTTANATVEVGANYGLETKTAGNCFAQLWNCSVKGFVLLRD